MILNPYKYLGAILICITIWALIECFKKEDKHLRFWILMIVLFGFFGAAAYFVKIKIRDRS